MLAKPGREVLFSVVPRDEKYEAKSLIDTFVYRGGDALGAFLSGALRAEGSAAVLSLLALPLCVLWGVAAVHVGRRHARLAPPAS